MDNAGTPRKKRGRFFRGNPADKASEYEEISRAAALAAAQQRGETVTGSTYCIDCGDVIPAAQRCTECQQYHEKTRHAAAKATYRRT